MLCLVKALGSFGRFGFCYWKDSRFVRPATGCCGLQRLQVDCAAYKIPFPGWFKNTTPTPSESDDHPVFEREYPEFCTRVERAPVEPFTNGVFCSIFFARYLGFCFFGGGIWVLGDARFPAKKKEKKRKKREWLGRDTFNTFAKFQGLDLSKTACDISTFVR